LFFDWRVLAFLNTGRRSGGFFVYLVMSMPVVTLVFGHMAAIIGLGGWRAASRKLRRLRTAFVFSPRHKPRLTRTSAHWRRLSNLSSSARTSCESERAEADDEWMCGSRTPRRLRFGPFRIINRIVVLSAKVWSPTISPPYRRGVWSTIKDDRAPGPIFSFPPSIDTRVLLHPITRKYS